MSTYLLTGGGGDSTSGNIQEYMNTDFASIGDRVLSAIIINCTSGAITNGWSIGIIVNSSFGKTIENTSGSPTITQFANASSGNLTGCTILFLCERRE